MDPQPAFHLSISGPSIINGSFSDKQADNIGCTIGTEATFIKDMQTWTMHEIVRDIPTQAHSLGLSFVSRGACEPGTIWFSGVQLEIVEQTTPLTGTRLGQSPHPLNLDFSQGLEFWQVQGQTPWLYTQGTEQHTAYLKSDIASSGNNSCSLRQITASATYLGKQVQFSALIKTALKEDAHAILFIEPLYTVGEGRQEIIHNTPHWQSITLHYKVPTNALNLTFGLILHGPGQCWLKDIHLHTLTPYSQDHPNAPPPTATTER